MSFLKNWKMKIAPAPVAHMPRLASQPKPEDNAVEQVKPANNQMTKFNGTKRKLAHFENLFKKSKD